MRNLCSNFVLNSSQLHLTFIPCSTVLFYYSLIGCVLNTLIRQKIRLGPFKIDWFFVLGKTQRVTVRKTFLKEGEEG